MEPSRTWALYWQIWALTAFTAFLIPEIWALCTNWQNTLSAVIWRAEKFVPGQSVINWSAFHFLFALAYTGTAVWLWGHFLFGIWRD